MKKVYEEVHKKFLALEAELRSRFFEREEVVRGLLVALVARGNVLVLGPPGTAKTDLAQTICGQVGGKFFARLLTKVSAPEELFGPLSLKALENDEYRRVTAGKLPEAHVAVIDEVFKCNSAVLNTLLPIMNERVFFDDSGQGRPIPLMLLVGLSNELPEGGTDGELAALWDRFDLRFIVDYLRDERNFSAMLGLNGSRPQTAITLAEVQQAQQEAAQVNVPEPVVQAMVRLWKELRQNGFVVSDRRFRNSLRFLKANAWLEGRREVAEDDFEILPHVMWQEPKQIRTVRKIVLGFANPLVVKANEIYDGAVELYQKLKDLPANSEEQARAATEANAKLKQAAKKLQSLAEQAVLEGKSPAAIKARIGQIQEINKDIIDKYLLGI